MVSVEEEITKLIEHIKRLGVSTPEGIVVKYGVFVKDDIVTNTFEGPFATLKAAKKRGIVDFKGEILLSPVHDSVEIRLLKDSL
ncbi:costars domain-containing protein [Cladochytrium replicatum]|nr:costars domain-containing protein [Cladochytrium replicatum]